ncbi:MAG: 16S rRNA (uracil1498-N3)-methyltransferase [Flavobacterium sp.]|jgi:16S rRNA (uracil1498-N3)-methyltransferase
MRYSRFYTDQIINIDEPVYITGQRAHYMRNVLRLNVGDKLCLFNGRGGEFYSLIRQVSKHEVILDVLSFEAINRQSSIRIELGLALIKRDAMDAAVQKATELGVSKVQPLICHNNAVPAKGLEKRLAHWQEVSINACEQCGLNLNPSVVAPIEISKWFSQDADLKLLASPFSKKSIGDIHFKQTDAKPSHILIAIGPEGGFTSEEIQHANEHGFADIFLGDRILRADTAASSMMTLVQSQWGDLAN